MENWGLCIFSFRWLMFDEKNGSASEKKRMAYCMTVSFHGGLWNEAYDNRCDT